MGENNRSATVAKANHHHMQNLSPLLLPPHNFAFLMKHWSLQMFLATYEGYAVLKHFIC